MPSRIPKRFDAGWMSRFHGFEPNKKRKRKATCRALIRLSTSSQKIDQSFSVVNGWEKLKIHCASSSDKIAVDESFCSSYQKVFSLSRWFYFAHIAKGFTQQLECNRPWRNLCLSYQLFSLFLSLSSNNRRNPLKENFVDDTTRPSNQSNASPCRAQHRGMWNVSRSGNAASTCERDDDEESREKTFRPKIARRNDPIKYFFSFVAMLFAFSVPRGDDFLFGCLSVCNQAEPNSISQKRRKWKGEEDEDDAKCVHASSASWGWRNGRCWNSMMSLNVIWKCQSDRTGLAALPESASAEQITAKFSHFPHLSPTKAF